MEYKKRTHNKPISVAIKGYLDKSGGKVTASRNEIEWRFNALDWKYQKQILFAFLQSGMSDRKWAYKKLFAFWDDCFIPSLGELWKLHHERELAWLIIQFFPTDCLKGKINEFSEGRNYYFLYRRLREDPDFVLDKTRLNEADLLIVMIEADEIVTDDDIRDMFYIIIYKLCKGVYKFGAYRVMMYDDKKPPLLTMFDSSIVRLMIGVIANKLGRYELVEELRKWMVSVSSDLWKEYGNSYNFGSNKERHKILSNHCMKYIPQEYKVVWDTFDSKNQQMFLDYLKERNKIHLQNADSDEIVRKVLRDLADSSSNDEVVCSPEVEITKGGLPF